MRKDLEYKEIISKLSMANFDILKGNYYLKHTEMLGLLDYGLHDKNITKERKEVLEALKCKYQFSLVLNESKIGIISDTHIGSELASAFYIKKSYDFFKENNITTVLHLGDILDGFDERDILTKNELIAKLYKQITLFHDIFPTNMTTYAILGNHDTKFKQLNIDLYKELSSLTFIIFGPGGAYINCSNYKLFMEHKVNSSILVPPYYNYDVILQGHSHLFKFKENRNIFKIGSCSNLQPNNYIFNNYAPGFAIISTTDSLIGETYNFKEDDIIHTLSLKLKD